jgi:hypothetical protein
MVYEQQEFGQNGETRDVAVGVKPEFAQWFNSQGFQVDTNFGGQANPNTATWTLYKNGQQINQQSQTKSKFDQIMGTAGPIAFNALMTTVTAGAIGPALLAAGIPAAVASAITPAVTSAALQLAQTGKVDLKTAAISAATSYVAPQIAQQIGGELQAQYGLSNSQVRAVQNSIASATATALRGGGGQQALRNAIAGAVAEGVGNATGNAALGKSAGTYISTGNVLNSAIAGITKELFPTAGKAPDTSKGAGETANLAARYPAPAPAPGDSTSTLATQTAEPGAEPSATGDVQAVTVTGSKPTGPETFAGAAPSPAPAPGPAPAPAPKAAAQPVDMYSTVRKDRGASSQLGTMLQGSLAPTAGLTQALGGFRAPGEVTTDPSGKRRQMVWNEASLKNLQDSLGL